MGDPLDSPLVERVNALSEHRAFALTERRARAVCAEVARTVRSWRAHFKASGVSRSDLELLSQQIDRPPFREQRDTFEG